MHRPRTIWSGFFDVSDVATRTAAAKNLGSAKSEGLEAGNAAVLSHSLLFEAG